LPLAPAAAFAQSAPVNQLPNSQWEIASGLGYDAKENKDGTGTMPPIDFSGYSTGANAVVVTTAGAQGDLKPGDLVVMRGSGIDRALTRSPMRVTEVSGTSFTIHCPLSLTVETSAPGSALPVNVGMHGGSHATGDAFDYWSKTISLVVWREDNPVNIAPGALYALGVNKDSGAREYVGTRYLDVHQFAGRTIVFGAYVDQKVRDGSGTWRLFVNSNAGVVTSAAAPTGDGYQWMEMSYPVPANASLFQVGLYFDGAAGDTYYVSNPVLAFGATIGVNNYAKPRETLAPLNGIVPMTWNAADIVFPLVAVYSPPHHYDIVFDAYAETGGQIAPSVVNTEGQLEGRDDGAVQTGTGFVRAIGFRNNAVAPITVGGIMAQTVAGVKSFTTMNITLGAGPYRSTPGGFAWANSAVAGDSWRNVALEFDRFFLQ
jgi:hypothetical protein